MPDRVIVIPNGCTDETAAVARRFPVTVLELPRLEHRKSEALNVAWQRHARDADVVICLDADTVLPPNAVGDWEAEMTADQTLGGSSSKFTMLGTDTLDGSSAGGVRQVDGRLTASRVDVCAGRHRLCDQRRGASADRGGDRSARPVVVLLAGRGLRAHDADQEARLPLPGLAHRSRLHRLDEVDPGVVGTAHEVAGRHGRGPARPRPQPADPPRLGATSAGPVLGPGAPGLAAADRGTRGRPLAGLHLVLVGSPTGCSSSPWT